MRGFLGETALFHELQWHFRTEFMAVMGAAQDLDQANTKQVHHIARAFPYFLICSPGKSPTWEPSQLETLQAASKIWHPHWKAGTAGPHQ